MNLNKDCVSSSNGDNFANHSVNSTIVETNVAQNLTVRKDEKININVICNQKELHTKCDFNNLNISSKKISDFKMCNELLNEFETFTQTCDKKKRRIDNCEFLRFDISDLRTKSSRRTVSEGDITKKGAVNENVKIMNDSELMTAPSKFFIGHSAQFSISSPDRKRCLKSIIEDLKVQNLKKHRTSSCTEDILYNFGDTPSTESLEGSPQSAIKSSRRRRNDRITTTSNGVTPSATPLSSEYLLHNNNNNNNNNHVKNERLSPGTPDTLSRSRSVTPSSASHPDTPPAPEQSILPPSGRNYSDFMRSLAAKYNNANPNDYFSAARNGFPPPLDARFKPTTFPGVLPNLSASSNKDDINKKPDFSSIINPFASPSMFPPLIDMSTTQALLAMVRTAKEAELQGLLKNVKRQEPSSPLDLSAAAPPTKRPRTKTPSLGSLSGGNVVVKRDQSESPRLQEDVSSWTVDDVCNFVSGIDICAEYARNFREQQIDGSGLPLLTEEHLTSTMNMKLGPALKLRSLLAKKLGSCNICLHCTHCHRNSSGSPDPGNTTGNTSDSGGVS